MEVEKVKRMLALLLVPLLLFALPQNSQKPAATNSGSNRMLAIVATENDAAPVPQTFQMMEPRSLMTAKISAYREDAHNLTKLLSVSEEEFEYLLSLQDENGLIAQTPDLDHSIPYFSNMAALALLGDQRGHEPVRLYMDWYLQHINKPDKLNMHGTMYDYRKQAGVWLPTYEYDSADSYAATFLTLAYNYTTTTGDMSYVAQNLQGFVDVAEVLIKLQDKDGLIWAKPKYYVKFLMDNAENYRGLRDAELLMYYIGRNDLAERYGQAASLVALGMEERLWLEDQQVYAWALYGRWWQRVPKQKWYPDTVGQIYPVVFGVIDPQSDRASHLYAYLNLHYPEWSKGRFDDRFPWTVLALMATLMNDDARAVEYLNNVYDSNTSQHRGYPWYSFESAFFVKAWRTLGMRYAVPAMADLSASNEEETIIEIAAEDATMLVASEITPEVTEDDNLNEGGK